MAQWGLAKCGGTTLAPGAAQRTHAVPPLLCRHLPPFMGDWGRSPQKAGAFLTLWNEVPEEIWPFSLNILAMPVMGDGDGLATMPCRLPSFRQLWLAMAFGQSPARAVFCPISPAFGDFASSETLAVSVFRMTWQLTKIARRTTGCLDPSWPGFQTQGHGQ